MLQCGREQPNCLRCRNGGRHCPGYEDKYIFLEHGHGPPRRAQSRGSHLGTDSGLSSPPSTISNKSRSPSSSTAEIAAPATDAPSDYRVEDTGLEWLLPRINAITHPQINTLYSPQAIETQLLSIYISSTCRIRTLPRELCLFREWLEYVPHYLGTSGVLHDAVQCLTAAQLGRFRHKDTLIRDSWHIYARALRRLHGIVVTPEGLSPQTLCATLLLSQYEARNSPGISSHKAATNMPCSS